MQWFFLALLAVGWLVGKWLVRAAQRRRHLERDLPVLHRLVAEKRYERALGLLERSPGFAGQHRLPPEQAIQIADLKAEALVGVGRVADAVVLLGYVLASRFFTGQWPADRLERWLTLYRQAGPIPVEDFYFCEVCGLHPEMQALLERAIESGCEPPMGFPGTHGSRVVVHLSSPRKARG